MSLFFFFSPLLFFSLILTQKTPLSLKKHLERLGELLERAQRALPKGQRLHAEAEARDHRQAAVLELVLAEAGEGEDVVVGLEGGGGVDAALSAWSE